MNAFIQKSCVEKAFLFDVVNKIYIATDSSPVEERGYELCSEMIDVVFDISCIYGYVSQHYLMSQRLRCSFLLPLFG